MSSVRAGSVAVAGHALECAGNAPIAPECAECADCAGIVPTAWHPTNTILWKLQPGCDLESSVLQPAVSCQVPVAPLPAAIPAVL